MGKGRSVERSNALFERRNPKESLAARTGRKEENRTSFPLASPSSLLRLCVVIAVSPPTKPRPHRSGKSTAILDRLVQFMTQKALIVRTGPDGHDGLKELNIELERGWRVARVSAMGGAGDEAGESTHAALVILERRERDRPSPAAAVAALEEIGAESEEVVEQVVEEAVEGNGANPFENRSHASGNA